MRTKNFIKIIISSTVLQIIIAISGIILPRLFIKYYGSEINGLISSIKQMITYFSMVSLGLGAASSVALYEPLDKRDYKKISSIISATRIFFNRTGYVFGSLVFLLTVLYPLLITSNESKINIAAIILVLGVGGLLEYIIITKYRILLIADQKNHIVSKITAQGVVLNTILSISLIMFNAPILVIQMASVSIYIFRLLLTKKIVQQQYPDIDFYANPEFTLISGRWDAFVYQLPNMAMTYTPIVLVTFFLGLNMASVYSVYNMIYSSIAMIVGVFSAGINGIFGNIFTKNDKELLENSYSTYSFIYRTINFSLYLSALVLTLPFLSLYIESNDGVNYLIPSVAYGFAIYGLMRNIRIPSVTLVEAAGMFKENKLLNFIEAIIMLMGSIILISAMGLQGILYSAAFAATIRTFAYIIYVNKFITFKKPHIEILKLASNLILFILMDWSLKYLISSHIVSSFYDWFILGIYTFAISTSSFTALNILIDIKPAKDAVSRIKKLLYK